MTRRFNPADTGRLDWSTARVGDPLPCKLCGRPVLLRHPVTGAACHKVCEDQRAAQFEDPAEVTGS